MAKAPSPSSVQRKKPAPVPAFVWNGQRYTFRPGEVNGHDDLAIYKATGLSVADIVADLDAMKMTLFGVGAMVWLARKQAGETLTLDQQLGETTMDRVLALVDTFEAEEADSGPPA